MVEKERRENTLQITINLIWNYANEARSLCSHRYGMAKIKQLMYHFNSIWKGKRKKCVKNKSSDHFLFSWDENPLACLCVLFLIISYFDLLCPWCVNLSTFISHSKWSICMSFFFCLQCARVLLFWSNFMNRSFKCLSFNKVSN